MRYIFCVTIADADIGSLKSYLISICTTCWLHLNKIVWSELHEILSFLKKKAVVFQIIFDYNSLCCILWASLTSSFVSFFILGNTVTNICYIINAIIGLIQTAKDQPERRHFNQYLALLGNVIRHLLILLQLKVHGPIFQVLFFCFIIRIITPKM